MPKLTDKLRADPNTPILSRGPVWEGPESNGTNGGITFSLLSRWLVCRERARLLMVEGLKPKDHFNHNLEYGNIWHTAEESFGKGDNANYSWQDEVTRYCQKLAEKYPTDREEIRHWHNMCMAQFPVYIEYWSKHPEQQSRKSLFQERVFKVPYTLPSGRTVYLRGKWDGGDLVDCVQDMWVQENKTKSQIDGYKIQRQLTYDLQTMLYSVAVVESGKIAEKKLDRELYPWELILLDGKRKAYKFKGIRYNVIRRSAHKTPESMYKKMTEDIVTNRGSEWFARWNVEITPTDIENFKKECLNPILENLCYWYQVAVQQKDPRRVIENHGMPPAHWRHPFGVYSPLDEGGSGELDQYMQTGSETGLQRTKNLFPELQEV